MSECIYLKISDPQIKGDVPENEKNDKNLKDTIRVQGFQHLIQIPTDPLTGVIKGGRLHGAIVITKEVDKSSPLLLKALCGGEEIKTLELLWYKTVAGKATHYFTTELKTVHVVNIKTHFPNCLLPETREMGHMEDVAFNYTKIRWTYLDGGIEGTDPADK